ncbi:MAG: class I SAM-dependent methyltransferase [Chloroflexota bacterium]
MKSSTDLSVAEKQLLDAILSIELYPAANPEEADENLQAGEKMTAIAENIRKRGNLIEVSTFGKKARLLDWTSAFPHLVEAGFILFEEGIYRLTGTGRIQAQQARVERTGRRFSDYFIRSVKSVAHAEFCQRVFGKNLCQADLMDMVQLEKLLEVLKLSADNKVLDLACGVGKIAEYISDTTEAHIIGVDIAKEAIAHAQERTRKKRDRMEFRFGDMNNLDFPPASFDTIIAIASLHYSENLDETIHQLVKILSPDGQMGLFSFQYASETESPDVLLPENTGLARVLQKHSLDFQTWEFTDQEIKIWRSQLQAAKELMEAYREEGNLDLCEGRIEECEIDLPRLETGRKRRYLYHVRL